ncbi:prenyltransferase/squalene oxidase repeat-containing protein [Botrimarina hoheduenensis]|uniref:Prenyltransferase and squalene oxidase repeat protein n=1 Tax=Botrimarina hoheduenensis TaxID=2528000 RepID=A0A5C5VYQ0_9BACT|nr:prenyltransferase/squalene oxidase repeat-containing protein [Botrimarina hoheduenensis]TWT42879.1 Prenyltransferase and squalene oxidase repeat protein [Botrimarina hoheduenensis]
MNAPTNLTWRTVSERPRIVLAVTMLMALAVPVGAQPTAAELIAPCETSIERGLAYLRRTQLADGGFGGQRMGNNPAVVALAGMAFLAGGSTPERGPYGDACQRCVDYLIDHTEPSGLVSVQGAGSHGPMYGHGFATLFMAEAYGMSPRPELRDKLASAVRLIVNAQNDEGGWRYQPQPVDADLSVTICQIMALRAARNAGVYVPPATVERCLDYVRRCQNPDGGFNYQPGPRASSLYPRSAAGVVALYSAGVYDGDEIVRGLDYLERQAGGGDANRSVHYYYGQYYAAQAMWQVGGERWLRWYPATRDELVARQKNDGSWDDNNGAHYATAMACIVLQTPNEAVPIFQR